MERSGLPTWDGCSSGGRPAPDGCCGILFLGRGTWDRRSSEFRGFVVASPMNSIDIRPDDPGAPDVVRLLRAHLDYARAWSSPEDVHVLNDDELASDRVEFFSARRADRLLAIGALSPVGDGLVEIKSMHTALEARRQGMGRAMLEHLVLVAGDRGHRWVALETGLGEAFAPARALYRSHGFQPCPPFGVHRASEDSICMVLALGS